jgi:hypothetical protein
MPESKTLRGRVICVAAALAAIAGAVLVYLYFRRMPAEVQAAFENAPELEILSIDPDGASGLPGEPYLGPRWRIIGRAKVVDSAERTRLLAAVNRAIASHGFGVMACFKPRHVVRAVRETETIDAVICFERRHIWFYRDGGHFAADTVGESAEPDLDEIFRAHGLPKAPPTH